MRSRQTPHLTFWLNNVLVLLTAWQFETLI